MTDKTITKLLGLVLLVNLAIACAFHLCSPAKPVLSSTVNRADAKPSRVLVQEPRRDGTSVPVRRPVHAFSSGRDDASTNAASEEDVLSRLRDWAGKDPESALAWGQQQPDGQERSEVLADACFQIARTDPRRAMVLAEQFHLNPDAVLENLAQQWAANDLNAAYHWIAAQPDDGQRNALVTGLTFIWSQTEPLNAAQFVVQQMAPGPAQDEAIMMVLHQWALADPAGASAWVAQFPDSPLRDRAQNELSGLARYKSPGPAN